MEEAKEQMLLNSNSNQQPSSSSSSSTTQTGAPSSSSSSSGQGAADMADTDIQVRPSYQNMFKPRVVETMMSAVLTEFLADKAYDQTATSEWAKLIAQTIKTKLKEQKLPRYKYLVQVIIGENKGAGVRCGCRCFWDQQTDKVAQANYTNVTYTSMRDVLNTQIRDCRDRLTQLVLLYLSPLFVCIG